MKRVDLSEYKHEPEPEEWIEENSSTASLKEYQMGDIVEVDAGVGVVIEKLTSQFGWPGDTSDADPEEDAIKEVNEDNGEIVMDATSDNPLYIVALQDGGSTVAEESDISEDASLDRDGKNIESWEDIGDEGVDEAEMAELYAHCDNPSSQDEWREAKAALVREQNAEAIAEHVEATSTSLEELAQRSAEELLNIPGVDDPEVGFASDPNGWDRTSYLDAWVTVGGMWRTCYPRMIRHFGPNRAKRWCAALKDEVLGTEEWRGDF